MVDAPERIWIEHGDECPYFYEKDELHEVGSAVTEYVRYSDYAALEAQLAALEAAAKVLPPAPVATIEQVLDAFDAETKMVPLGHENRQRGASTYNWRRAIADEIRSLAAAMIAAAPGAPSSGQKEASAIRIASRGPNGEAPVLVLRAEALSRTDAVKAVLSGDTSELIDRMAAAIREDGGHYDDAPWDSLSDERKEGWRGDARRALAVVKEYLTARLPEPASLIQSQAARIAELEAGLDEAMEALDWASRRMKGNCARDDVSAVMLSASRARALLNKENRDD